MSTRFIHVIACVEFSFQSWVIFHIHIRVYHSLLTYSSTEGHMGCFHLLAIANDAAMNMDLQISFWVPVFNSFSVYPERELLDHMEILFLHFWGAAILLCIGAASFSVDTGSAQGSGFSTPSPILNCFLSLSFFLLMVAILMSVKWSRSFIFTHIFSFLPFCD